MSRRRSGSSADLVQAAARFDRWRRSASATGRIPDSLWMLAVDLTREHVYWFTVNWNFGGRALASGERHPAKRVVASCHEGLSL